MKNKIIIILIMSFSFMVLASEDTGHGGGGEKEAPPAAEGHGAPAEGNGHGEAPAAQGPKKETWGEVSARVQGLKAKIKSKQEVLSKILLEKDKQHDEAKKNEMIKDAIKEHKELQELIKDYDKERVHLQFGFPEGGQKKDGKYKHIEPKKFEEMSQELSLQTKLDRTMKLLRKQYKLVDPEDPKAGKKTRRAK